MIFEGESTKLIATISTPCSNPNPRGER